MTTYTTTCPFCQAQFYITDEQLGLKAGKARCGQCSQIFQANEHLSSATTAEAQPPAAEEVAVSLTSPSSAQLDAVLGDAPQAAKKPSMADASADLGLIDDNTLIDDDFMQIADDLSPSSVSNKAVNPDIDEADIFGDEISSEFRQTMTNLPAVSPDDFSLTNQQAVGGSSDEKWIESLLSEEEEDIDPYKTKEEKSEDLIGFLEDIGANTAQFSAVSPSQLANKQVNTPLTKDSTTKIPIREVHKSKSKGSFGRVFGLIFWGVLSLAMLGVLYGQYLYFNYDTLSRDAESRKKLSTACGFVGCTLPDINADAIAFKEVATKAADAGKSTLSFVIHNQSQQAALLPAVKVSLYKNGEVVGENVIKPTQYLTAGHKRLPAMQPIDGKVTLGKANTSFDDVKLVALY